MMGSNPLSRNAMPAAIPSSLPVAWRYVLAAAACGLVTVLAKPLGGWLDPANIVMLFLLAVFLVALRLGQGPALLAALMSVALFDFFFVPPSLSFAVHDAQYIVTFVVMLAVALTTGQLAARLGDQAEASRENEARTRDLYYLARELAGAFAEAQVADIAREFLRRAAQAQAVLYLPDDRGTLAPVADVGMDDGLAQRAYQRQEVQERLGATGRGDATCYLPLMAPMRIRGVLGIALDAKQMDRERGLLDAVASLTALTLERLHYVQVAQASEVRVASERLRASILSSLSHDLRTPLTALVGLTDTLAGAQDLPDVHRETARSLHDQATLLSGMVTNLLDLARLSAGGVTPRKDWHSLEEVVGAAIQWSGPALGGHDLRVAIPEDLPLLEFDPLLMERVLCNLLDNAARHTPPGGAIRIDAARTAGEVEVAVRDTGAGFPPPVLLAEPFARDEGAVASPGAGLGLAICKVIVEAHGGRLILDNPPEGGGRARFTLPLGSPPGIEEEA